MSRAANGSSSSSIFGSPSREMAIVSFFLCPPDKNFALIFVTGSSSNFEISELILEFLSLSSLIKISPIALRFSNKVKSEKYPPCCGT